MRRLAAAIGSLLVLLLAIGRTAAIPLPVEPGGAGLPALGLPTGHLVISEVMTGGTSASDEFIELYNPTSGALPLEGLEVVYVTASGATVTRKAAWATGAAGVPAGSHLLLANDAGIFLPIADLSYANGLAATGGSVALRVQGAATAIDAVGWGTAASTWLETPPAPAPLAGSSIERLPGGGAGSGQDTDINLVDFAIRSVPDPQNIASPPVPTPSPSSSPTVSPSASASVSPSASASVSPSASASASPSATPSATPTATASPSATPSSTPTQTPSPTPSPTLEPTPSPTPAPISIASARTMPDGAEVTVEGVTLTDEAFTDGGGFIDDGSAGIAVLLSDAAFPRGALLRVTGTLDDRYSQRTIRTDASGISVGGTAAEPSPAIAATGTVGEALEGRLVQLSGEVASALDTLTAGIAFDLDDGSGPERVVIGSSTGIDTSGWSRGVRLTLVGVVGQRDSSGTGAAGYRVQPRDSADVIAVEPPAIQSPTPSAAPTSTPSSVQSSSPTASASPSPSPGSTVSIAAARAAASGTHVRIRGVVTAQSGLIDPTSAVLQDPSGAILIRIGDDVGTLARGELVELDGIRSTMSGMLTLRVSVPPTRLGTQAEPTPFRGGTGVLGEAQEAWLVIVRGAVVTPVLRSTAGTVSFGLDDGSGPLRISISPRSGITTSAITRGAWFELRGVLGQETTGREPDRGYRLWPRTQADLAPLSGPSGNSPSPVASASAGVGPVPVLTWRSGSASPGPSGAANRSAGEGNLPLLSLSAPTATPSDVASIADTQQATPDDAPWAAALLGAAFGMALIAGLLALRGRRLRAQREPAQDGVDGEIGAGIGPDELAPRLALVPLDAVDKHEEQRILPPI
ncbi:MAG TPA: lamin tail domain-containing protein [Candidatus Saccharimonadales bacterium]|nr:lamin tail domain-containing protein [Candidatus Saccharimonadales bacterium]